MDSMNKQLLFSSYYQAHIKREMCWFVTATLRSYEHLAFDRTLDPEASLFEFFVSPGSESCFLELMNYYQQEGLVSNVVKLHNRLADSTQHV